MPTKGNNSQDGGETGVVKRRDLVTIVIKPEESNPHHIYSRSGTLIAQLPTDESIDPFLDRLDESVFHRK